MYLFIVVLVCTLTYNKDDLDLFIYFYLDANLLLFFHMCAVCCGFGLMHFFIINLHTAVKYNQTSNSEMHTEVSEIKLKKQFEQRQRIHCSLSFRFIATVRRVLSPLPPKSYLNAQLNAISMSTPTHDSIYCQN